MSSNLAFGSGTAAPNAVGMIRTSPQNVKGDLSLSPAGSGRLGYDLSLLLTYAEPSSGASSTLVRAGPVHGGSVAGQRIARIRSYELRMYRCWYCDLYHSAKLRALTAADARPAARGRLQPPRWPDANYPPQMHLDIGFDDRAGKERLALDLGATGYHPKAAAAPCTPTPPATRSAFATRANEPTGMGARFTGWPEQAFDVLAKLEGDPPVAVRESLREEREQLIRQPMIALWQDLAGTDAIYANFTVPGFHRMLGPWQQQVGFIRPERNIDQRTSFDLDGLYIKAAGWYMADRRWVGQWVVSGSTGQHCSPNRVGNQFQHANGSTGAAAPSSYIADGVGLPLASAKMGHANLLSEW
jgi:hypothetical protein